MRDNMPNYAGGFEKKKKNQHQLINDQLESKTFEIRKIVASLV